MNKRQNFEFDNLNRILDINRVIHEPSRLLILRYLEALEYCDFNFLMKSTGLTKGNLSSHIRKLEDNGLVIVEKKIINRKSNTIFKITKLGLSELTKYKNDLKSFLKY